MTSFIAENDIVSIGGYYVIIKLENGFQAYIVKMKKGKLLVEFCLIGRMIR